MAFIEATRESFPLMVSMDFQDALGMEYSDLRAGTSKVFLNLDEEPESSQKQVLA